MKKTMLTKALVPVLSLGTPALASSRAYSRTSKNRFKSISVGYVGTDWVTGGLMVVSIKLRTSLPTVSPGMYRFGPPPLPQTKLNLT